MRTALLSRLLRIHALFSADPEAGQGLVEYAMILVLAVVMVIVLVSVLGPWVGNVFSNITNSL